MQKTNSYSFGWHDDINYLKKLKGISKDLVLEISDQKKEPQWMLDIRLKALEIFFKLPMPQWAPDISGINYDEIFYYLKPNQKITNDWEKVPKKIKQTFEKLGIPQSEKEMFAGVKSQYDSEVIYASLKNNFSKLGVIFCSMEEAVKNYPEIVQKYFTTIVPIANNKFSALNTAVWSGGSFLFVPKSVKITQPLQSYFRLNSALSGQFERSLIIVEDNAYVEYLEGCSAPVFSKSSLHAGVVEVYVGQNATCQFSTIQNWYTNVYNLSTKRAIVNQDSQMTWLDANFGSKLTMKYPSCILQGKRAKGTLLSVSFAGKKQNQDTGTHMIHSADETESTIMAKSVSYKGGIASFRGGVTFSQKALNCRSKVVCDGLLLDNKSQSNTFPKHQIYNSDCQLEHEAKVSSLDDDEIFYLQTKGFPQQKAQSLIVSGFLDAIIEKLPLEQAVELGRLIEMEIGNN